jgi:hypothetical protein
MDLPLARPCVSADGSSAAAPPSIEKPSAEIVTKHIFLSIHTPSIKGCLYTIQYIKQ